jgi:membrane protease YdiL (CAAX protease family)
MHLLNLSSGREVVWVLGQVGWAAILGVFYGYIVLKTDSLLPAMVVHWLGNAFVYTFTRYLQLNASITTQAIYGVIFSFGLVPTVLMIVWVRFVVARWPRVTAKSWD